jgi:hypothetical protein
LFPVRGINGFSGLSFKFAYAYDNTRTVIEQFDELLVDEVNLIPKFL